VWLDTPLSSVDEVADIETDTRTTAATTPDEASGRWAGRPLSSGHRIYWWAELALVALLYGIYSMIRNVSTSGAEQALSNARRVVTLQDMLGLNEELNWQAWALQHHALIVTANYFYGAAYVVVTIGTLVWLFRRFPDSYPFWRNTLAAGTLIALAGFALFPLMPPRLLDAHDSATWGFVDTMAQYPTLWSFQSEAIATISNQFAAMPSLHFGWSLWVFAALWPHLRTAWARALAMAYPLATVMAVVVTGNHFFIDAAGGAAVMIAAYGVARLVTRAGHTGPPARPPRRRDSWHPEDGSENPASRPAPVGWRVEGGTAMVRTPERSSSGMPTRQADLRDREWPGARWRRHRRPQSIAGTLRLLDDDPFLLCDCDDGAPHTCG
jgi:hypothetical protein